MSPTNEQIIAEAERRWLEEYKANGGKLSPHSSKEIHVINIMRENWTPPEPEPVDPDILAFREWLATSPLTPRPSGDPNRYGDVLCETFLAGARMAREKERERAKVLLDYAWEDVGAPGGDEAKARSNRAFDIITKYEKGDQ